VVASLAVLLAITTTGKVVLILVAGTFIVFSLVASMVVPRRYPSFPGSGMKLFVAVCIALFAAQISAVVWVTSTQEVEEESAAAENGGGETTTSEETTPAQTTSTTTTSAPAAEPGDAAAGKTVFASAGCEGCHTLSDAGANGSVGPNLDDVKPPYSLVIDRVTNGKGVMPSFKGRLSEAEIQNVAKYVSTVAGK
jgi:mono/diheme cytochrome c family protein